MPQAAALSRLAEPAQRPGIEGVRRLALAAAVGMVLVVFTVLASVVYAAHQIDSTAIADERQRAHVALAVLDGQPLDATQIGQDYVLTAARLATPGSLAKGEVAVAVPGRNDVVLAWTPHRIGSDLFLQIAPLRLAISGLFMAGVAFVLWQMLRIAHRLDEARRLETERASRDPLTGLANRACFEEHLEAQFDSDTPVGLLYLDLDDFKVVNDRYGHPVGDEVLREIGRRLTGFSARGTLIARIGGDEFAVVVERSAGRPALEELAGDIAARLNEDVQVSAGFIRTGVSIGIADRGPPSRSPAALIAAADTALYGAKYAIKTASPAA